MLKTAQTGLRYLISTCPARANRRLICNEGMPCREILAFLGLISATAASTLLTGGQIRCLQDSDCYSGLCYTTGSCAPDGPVPETTPGGSICVDHSDCFSNHCVHFVCASDSPVRGKVAAGGLCEFDHQCYSGSCYNRRCGPDSILQGKIAAGGRCDRHDHCYSGYCNRGKCGPDGAVAGRVPAGGYCEGSGQCVSNVCIEGRCSPESTTASGKVADGGRCVTHSSCENGVCYENICTRPAEKGVHYGHGHPGSVCKGDKDCSEFPSCIDGRCAPPSRWNAKVVADGGVCYEHEQCQSGNCYNRICAVSHFDRRISASIAAGASCGGLRHEDCWSCLCVEGYCSSDSLQAPETEATKGTKKNVAAGGLCERDIDCYSGYCDNHICGPSGPTRGKVAPGGVCTQHWHCYSGHCHERRCMTGADVEGKVAPGGRCASDQSCPTGTTCVNVYCATGSAISMQPVFQSVDVRGACWNNAQCKVGFCVDAQCTVPWFANSGTKVVDLPAVYMLLVCAISIALYFKIAT